MFPICYFLQTGSGFSYVSLNVLAIGFTCFSKATKELQTAALKSIGVYTDFQEAEKNILYSHIYNEPSIGHKTTYGHDRMPKILRPITIN